MKKHIAIATAALIFITLFSGTASAGSSKRHTVEGIIIGAGAALVGAAIIQNLSRPHPVADTPSPYRHHRPHNGHWSAQRVWVPAVTGSRWNPGHYTPQGRWIPGHYQNMVISPGHWDTRREWISSNCGGH